MPVLKIKTIESKVGWTNPSNPDMVSYDLTIDVGGKKAEARTYSKAVAELGFEGEVETYEKNDHTYLKQKQTGSFQPRRSFGGPAKDNSDGQRQGMCINNAANYVNSQGKDYSPADWAERVWGYANAIYSLGDLKKEDSTTTVDTVAPMPEDDKYDLTNVNELFKN
jgi:hypothetical protein